MTVHPLLAGLEDVRRNWGWFLVLGIALILLGIVAFVATPLATLATILLFGWLLLGSGVVEAIAAFYARQWSGFFLHLLAGVLNFVVGLLIIGHPLASAAGVTLILAVLFLVGGFFRVCAAVAMKPPHWGWELFGGAVTAILGGMIWARWPSDSPWVIG